MCVFRQHIDTVYTHTVEFLIIHTNFNFSYMNWLEYVNYRIFQETGRVRINRGISTKWLDEKCTQVGRLIDNFVKVLLTYSMHTKNTYKGVDPELKLTVHTCSKFWFHIGNMGNNEWSRHSILHLYVVNRHSISCLQGLVQGGGSGGYAPRPP